MFTSSADVFRTRQAVHDLLQVVRTHRNAVERLGATGTDRSEIVAITTSGCQIMDAGTRAYSTILLAAAMPDEDFNAFIAATAILLADRLQDGAGEDDLYWNYDAFRDHYRLADAPVRAALMNGFRFGQTVGRVNLPEAPASEVCLTRPQADVVKLLRAEGNNTLTEAVLSDLSAKAAGALWVSAAKDPLSMPAKAGLRYLYERPDSMAPDQPEDVPLIPWT